jgi:hypothetical protein
MVEKKGQKGRYKSVARRRKSGQTKVICFFGVSVLEGCALPPHWLTLAKTKREETVIIMGWIPKPPLAVYQSCAVQC